MLQFVNSERNEAIASFKIVDEFKEGSPSSYAICRGTESSPASTGFRNEEQLRAEFEALSENHLFQPDSKSKSSQDSSITVKVESTKFRDSQLLSTFEDKSIDLLFIDHFHETPSQADSPLDSVLKAWFNKIKEGGIIVGHSYGVVTPYQATLSDTDFQFPVFWNTISPDSTPMESGESKSMFLNREQLESTKNAIDDYIIKSREEIVGTGGIVTLAGDTSWYIQRHKLSFKDIFGNGNRSP